MQTIDRRILVFMFVILLVPLTGCLDDNDGGEDMSGLAKVSFYKDDQMVLSIDCEIADSDEERQRGLMDRDELPRDRGMLFYYERSRTVSIWMKNTSFPLDIVFVDPEFNIINIEHGEPGIGIPDDLLEIHNSGGECRYIIEMNKGLCFSNGIEAGSTVSIWEY